MPPAAEPSQQRQKYIYSIFSLLSIVAQKYCGGSSILIQIARPARSHQNGVPADRPTLSNNIPSRHWPSASPHVHQNPPVTAIASLMLPSITRLSADHWVW